MNMLDHLYDLRQHDYLLYYPFHDLVLHLDVCSLGVELLH